MSLMADFIENDSLYEDDPWTRLHPLTLAELAAHRQQAVMTIELFVGIPLPEMFTCDDCARASVCRCVFDAYNTGGDCLWEK